MESVSTPLACLSVFGVFGSLPVFIPQMLLNRNKSLNKLAQQAALQQEIQKLAAESNLFNKSIEAIDCKQFEKELQNRQAVLACQMGLDDSEDSTHTVSNLSLEQLLHAKLNQQAKSKCKTSQKVYESTE